MLCFLCIEQTIDIVQKKLTLVFNVNNSIPQKIFLTDGKGDEHPFVSKILSPGQTGIMDRYYQRHKDFGLWQTEEKHFVCRIPGRCQKIRGRYRST
jgi:transposase, IS4 family